MKPDWCPQDIWDWAYDVLGQIASERMEIDGDSEVTLTGVDLIARAIITAKSEEREDCEEIALKIADSYEDRANRLPEDSYKVPYRLHSRNGAQEVANAIRNRP